MRPRNFLIIVGAAKTGTNSLAKGLRECAGFARFQAKEPGYFSQPDWRAATGVGLIENRCPDLASYYANYRLDDPQDWCIDASVDYLWRDGCLERLRAFAGDHEVRLLCVLRDPVDRALSQYRHTLRDGYERHDFPTALALEERRRRDNAHPLFFHVRRSTYHADLARYRAAFGDRLMTMGFGDLADHAGAMARVCAFLGVPFRPPETPPRHYNASGQYLPPAARALLRHQGLRGVARTVLPKHLRKSVGRSLWHRLRCPVRITEADHRAAFAHLREDALRCMADPSLPTADWATTRRLAEEAAAA